MKVQQHLIFLLFFCFFSTPIAAQKWVVSPTSTNLLPNNYGIYGIKVVDKEVIWATANFATGTFPATHLIKILRSTNGGQTWQLSNVNAAVGHLAFDIQAFDATTAWISTFSNNNSTKSGLFKTTDGGQTWVQKLADSVGNHHLRFLDRNNGVCITQLSRRFAYTSDGGENWTIDNTSLAFNEKERSAASISGTNGLIRKGDTLWFGTTAGRIFRSINKGRNWTPYAAGIPPSWIIPSLAFIDARNGMLVGTDSTNFKLVGIAKTNDGGQTWQVVPMTLVSASFNNLPLITAIPNKNEKNYLLGTENSLSTIAISFLTRDDGNSWNVTDKDINSHGASEFLSGQIGWIGNGYVNNTRDATTMFKWDDLGLFTPTAEPYDNDFFSLSPNPAKDILNLQFENTSILAPFDIQITDVAGSIVFKTNTANKQLVISQLSAGVYFLTVKTKDKIGVTKFIKD
jgi:hypothetical protein